MKNRKIVAIIPIILIIGIGSMILISFFDKQDTLPETQQTGCLGSCRCMEECNKEGPTYFIPAEEGASECAGNTDGKICCCSGV
ncbi:hypothetical protein CMO89_01465 [Candidatus Woesearchaeota archaeon]|nr:hypothetical protein [Candidatus Woesearchaeota archaeon]|tara:strand:- start:2516 stop:2767 length:252 start_codon:yes stop_codon:yes gene_type:complete